MNGNDELRDRTLAYTLLRLFLGVNIMMHGISRLAFDPSKFYATIEGQFAHNALPHPLVMAFAVTLPWAEAWLGFLILAGLFTRFALAAGGLLMVILTFGSCLVQDWQAAGTQLIYAIAYSLLLFVLRYNNWSVDGLLQRPLKPTPEH